jgi:hypothetical protein
MGKTRTAAQLVNHNSNNNTGDQSTISGNAGTATALQTARNISGKSFDGTADIDLRPVSAEVSGSDFTTTSNAATDITGLSVAVLANKKYKVCVLNITSATANGMKFTMSAPAAATIQQIVVNGPAASVSALKMQRISTFGTLTASAFMTAASNSGCTIIGFFSTGANAGNVKLQVAAATNGDTMTISIGSTMEISERT